MKLWRSTPRRSAPPWWFLALLGLYAVLELSFNHHLLQASSGGLPQREVLEDLESWARIISGLGLAFWLLRALLIRMHSPWLALLLSVTIGITLMWHLQRWLVDTIVAQASDADKRMSLYAQMLAPEAMAGRVQVKGLPLVQPESLSEASRGTWDALLPAITLGLTPQDLQSVQAERPSPANLDLGAGEGEGHLLTDAYRRAVMVPIALGVSLLFGLANLCLWVSLVLQRAWRGRRSPAPWQQRAVFFALWVSVLVWSWSWLAEEVESKGYREVARPALRAEQPLLSPFVEWSLRAVPAWQGTTRWMHETLLRGYGFRRLTAV